jgi:hypothetical protein
LQKKIKGKTIFYREVAGSFYIEVTGIETDLHKRKKPSRKAELFPFVEMGGS